MASWPAARPLLVPRWLLSEKVNLTYVELVVCWDNHTPCMWVFLLCAMTNIHGYKHNEIFFLDFHLWLWICSTQWIGHNMMWDLSTTCIHLIYTTLVNLASFLAIFSLYTIPHQTYKTNHRKLVNYWPIKCLSQSTNSSLALGFHKLSLAMSRSPFLLFTLKSRCNGETYQHCAYIIRLRSRSCVKNNTKAI